MVVVEWTGEYPNLCRGEWHLKIHGVDYSHAIPKEKHDKPMGTYGIYRSWHFNEEMIEIFENYTNGLQCEEWIAENPWVNNLPCSPIDVFYAFQANDWRHGSCGGCI